MTSAADEAAAALRASKAINEGQQNLTEESRLLLAALLREEMRVAVAEGIEAVITNEQVWAKVFQVLQRQAAERTGRFFLSGAIAFLRKLLWVGAFVGIAYAIGGWALLKAVWTAFNKG